jgi:hypothetical protein
MYLKGKSTLLFEINFSLHMNLVAFSAMKTTKVALVVVAVTVVGL